MSGPIQHEHGSESRWELRPAGCFIALAPEGVRLGLRRRGLETSLIRYEDLTHVEVTSFGVWLASRRTTMVIRRSQFVRERDPDELVQSVRWRLGEEPGGVDQLARMRAIAERALHPHPRIATYLLLVACVAVFVLEFVDPFALQAGVFVPELVGAGEWWRITTGNLLHGVSLLPLHLIINMMCLTAFGLLVERPLGAVRTFLVMAASGVGAMAASALAGYTEVLGASGVVAGLVGAVLWLEFNEPERLPAWWRIPRRVFVVAILLQGVVDLLLPFIAAAAHLGGLAAGWLVMPFAARGALDGKPASREQRYAAAGLVVVILASLVSAAQLVRREPTALAAHGRNLLSMQDVAARGLNDLAWRMVTESHPDAEDLLVATRLAELAVEKTGRRDPNILDTLAEVLFISGDDSGAIAVIDEAITLAGSEEYFLEQRRRFTGERAIEDRPAPPTHWILPAPESGEVIPLEESGIAI